jgi:hypothetical protein
MATTTKAGAGTSLNSSSPKRSGDISPKPETTLQGYVTTQLLPSSLPKLGKTVYSEISKLGARKVHSGLPIGDKEGRFVSGYCQYLAKAILSTLLPSRRPLQVVEFTTFYSLVEDCWESGIPVVFIRRLPKSCKFPHWVVVEVEGRPVIFLSGMENAMGLQSLYLAEAIACAHQWPASWVRKFLFAKGLKMPRKGPAEKLIEFGYNTPYQPDLVVAYICSQWGPKYGSLMRQCINYHKAHFNVADYAAEIFTRKILPNLQSPPLPVQYLLFASLAANPSNITERHVTEEDFLHHKLNSLEIDLPPSVWAGAKTLVSILRVFPVKLKVGLSSLEFQFLGETRVRIREGGIFDFESSDNTMVRAKEELSDVFPSPFGYLFYP